jgi:Protein of unknown function (DUF1523)
MTYVKWTVFGLLIAAAAAFFHYWLPQHDSVRIVETGVTRMDVSDRRAPAEGAAQPGIRTRDVRLIYAKLPDGDDMVYRNEDTGWGFPFYFKFDSDDLMAQASDLRSTADNPRWVIVRHYGWRIPWLSMYPNALSIWQASGPDEEVFPWFAVIFLTLLVIGLLVVRRMILILRRRHVDPVVADIDREFDETAAWWRRSWRRLVGRR